jgi:hypothetical protein
MKLLTICAGALFGASLIFVFLGADSVERPATMPLMNAGMICLVASVIVFLVRLGFAIAQKRRTDAC